MKIDCPLLLETEHEACLECALQGAQCGFSYPLLKALYASVEERPDIHVTDLSGCLLKAYYDKVEPPPVSPHKSLPAFHGKAEHAFIEALLKDDPNARIEVEIDFEGIKGRADAVIGEDLYDFKTTSKPVNPSFVPYGNHAIQVQYYRAMLGLKGKIFIQYIELGRKKFNGVYLCEVEPADNEVVLTDLRMRASLLRTALDGGELPWPAPSWLCEYCSHITRCAAGQLYLEDRKNGDY